MNDEPYQTDEIVDVEAHFGAGTPVPKAKKYRIRLDKQQYVVSVEEMTGREILALAGKTPDKFLLRQKLRSGVQAVEPDEVVSFVGPGVERFMTIPNEVTEGDAWAARRNFELLPADIAFLDSLGMRWEAVVDGGTKAVIIYDWPIPAGYNTLTSTIHIRLNGGYPDSQIDMAYFMPALARADSRPVGGLSPCVFDGHQWQQWSRHRTANSQWRIGEDDLSTHLALVNDWLEAELRK